MAARKILETISNNIGTKISVGKVRYGINKNLIIRNLYIEDQQKDTLLYIRRLEAQMDDFDFNAKNIAIQSFTIKDANGNIKEHKDSTFNYTFIIKSLKSKNSTPFNWIISCEEFSIINSAIAITRTDTSHQVYNKITLKASHVFIDSIQQQFVLNQFKTNLNNTPFLNNVTGVFNKNSHNLKLGSLNILSANSHINIESANLNLPSKTNPLVFSYNSNIVSSNVLLSDFSEFLPKLRNLNDKISLSGIVKGNKNSIQGKSIRLNIGKESSLLCNFSILNFKDPEQINYSLDIQNLFSNKNDVTHILSDYFNQDTSAIPIQLSMLEDITYKGQLNGGYFNLYNNGIIVSKFGEIESDITLKRSNADSKIWLEGKLKALPVYLDAILQNNEVGEIAFDLNTKGYFSKNEGSNFDITGKVTHLYYENYSFDSIDITGNISPQQFIGRVSSFDPKLRFDFDGLIKFDTLPSYDFLLNLYYANLYELGINKKDSSANLSFTIKADFIGNNIDNSSGEVLISDIFYFSDSTYFATDSISITSNPIAGGKEVNLYSEYAEAHVRGHYQSFSLYRSIKTLVNNYIPSIGFVPSEPEYENNISFDFIATYPHPITHLISPDLTISPGTYIYGDFDASTMSFDMVCESNQIDFFGKKLVDLNLKTFTRNNKVSINLSARKFNYFQENSLKNFHISTSVFNDSIQTNFNWNNWLDLNYSGNINTLLTISANPNREKPDLKLDIFPSNIIVLDTLWFLSKGYVKRDSIGYTFHNLKIDNSYSKWDLSGILSDNPLDSIALNLEEISMDHLNILLKNDNLVFGGTVTGSTLIYDIKGERKINSDLQIENLSLNKELIGDTKILTHWDKNNQSLIVNGKAINNTIENFFFEGYVSPAKKEININTHFNQQALKVIEPYLNPTFENIKGTIDGNILIYGNLKNPKWQGSLMASNAELLVTPTNVNYHFDDSIFFQNRQIIFKNVQAFDENENKAILNGEISHEYFQDFFFDIKLETNKILAVDLKSYHNPYYYGKIYGSGNVLIKGPSNIIDINIAAKTESYSYIRIPLEGKGDIKENDFIEFVNPYAIKKSDDAKEKSKTAATPNAITNIRIDLDVTPDLEVQIVFDPQIGDMLRANGIANLTIESLGPEFNMYGEYTITKGDFMFTLQNVINKRLEIQQGSTVSWTGHPLDANINMDAVYKVRKASVYDLTKDDADKEKRVEVNTHLLMTEKLVNPTIKFSVDVPSATNEEAIDQLNSLPEEELNKQVLSLLLVNKFTALTTYQTGIAGNATGNLTATTASELLSNQLSNWMSQISNDFDLGFVYRPGDENTQQEVEVAISTNLFNDRILFNGNVGYSENQRTITDNPMTTDFQIEYKVNDKGNIRLRAFQKLNNDITYNQAPYTQGFGIFYTDDFNNFNELLQKMFRRESAAKPKEIEIIEEDSDISN